MILQKEIIILAEQLGVAKSTVEKDWVLGHFIAAIYSQSELNECLVFKGGTCLKKCWIPDYRFSEDLDFTSINPEFILTRKHLQAITDYLLVNEGIQTHIESIHPLKFNDRLTGYEAKIKYWGADHPANAAPPVPERWSTSIKIEIILYETLLFPVARRAISHHYSDQIKLTQDLVPCYAIEEILAEKIRALIQRSYSAPRDLYDIWYLTRIFPNLDYKAIREAFHKKMHYKNLEYIGIHQLIDSSKDKVLMTAWNSSLGHQISGGKLPEFEKVKSELLTVLKMILE